MSLRSFQLRMGRLVSNKSLEGFEKKLKLLGINISAEKWFGFWLLTIPPLSLIVAGLLNYFKGFTPLVSLEYGFLSSMVLYFIVNSIISFQVNSKINFVETNLPDFLLLIVANIRSGITPQKALKLSARPEFGILSEKIELATKKMSVGESFVVALKKVNEDIPSKILRGVIDLLVEGIRSGGELGKLLEESSKNIRQSQLLKNEVRASVSMYMIFIFISVGFAAPVLFGVSTHLSLIINNLLTQIDIPEDNTNSAFKIGTPSVTTEFLVRYSVLNMIISSFFGGLIIGMIDSGKSIKGIKYIPLLLLFTMSIFFGTRFILSSLLSI